VTNCNRIHSYVTTRREIWLARSGRKNRKLLFVLQAFTVRNEVGEADREERGERERAKQDQRPYLIVEAGSLERVQR
jgi:hypothetical protein